MEDVFAAIPIHLIACGASMIFCPSLNITSSYPYTPPRHGLYSLLSRFQLCGFVRSKTLNLLGRCEALTCQNIHAAFLNLCGSTIFTITYGFDSTQVVSPFTTSTTMLVVNHYVQGPHTSGRLCRGCSCHFLYRGQRLGDYLDIATQPRDLRARIPACLHAQHAIRPVLVYRLGCGKYAWHVVGWSRGMLHVCPSS